MLQSASRNPGPGPPPFRAVVFELAAPEASSASTVALELDEPGVFALVAEVLELALELIGPMGLGVVLGETRLVLFAEVALAVTAAAAADWVLALALTVSLITV